MFYVLKNGEQKGPYEENIILACLKDGTFDYSDLVWKEGWTEWKELEAVFTKPSTTPPPAPAFARKQVGPPTKVAVEKRGGIFGKPLIFGILGLLLLWYIASPYIATFQLFSALKSGDTATLRKRIDFRELRESLKEEMKAKMLQETKKTISKSSNEADGMSALGAGLAVAFGPAFIDGIVDSYVTPSGLAGLISNPDAAVKGKGGIGNIQLQNINWAFFSGLTEFKITNKDGVSLFLHLNGISWSLYQISFGDKGSPFLLSNDASITSGKRNAQNLASVSAAAAAAGATRAQLGSNLPTAIANLTNGITVTNNGQVMGPFKIEGLPSDLSHVTNNLTFDQDTGMIRYTPSSDQTKTYTQNNQQTRSAGKRNAQNLASVSAAACAAGATKAQLGTDLRSAIAALTKGISVTNNGQVMGPFRVDGLPDDLSQTTSNLTFDQDTGVIRYTPSNE